MAKQDRIQMPSSGAGIMRYFDDYKSKIEIKPEHVVIFAILAVVVVFGSAAGWFGQNWPSWLDFLRDPETQSLVIIILVFGIIIWFITKEDKKDKDKSFLDFFKEPIKNPYGKKD